MGPELAAHGMSVGRSGPPRAPTKLFTKSRRSMISRLQFATSQMPSTCVLIIIIYLEFVALFTWAKSWTHSASCCSQPDCARRSEYSGIRL